MDSLNLEDLVQERRAAQTEVRRQAWLAQVRLNEADLRACLIATQRDALGIHCDDSGAFFTYKNVFFTVKFVQDLQGYPLCKIAWRIGRQEHMHHIKRDDLWDDLLDLLATIS